MTFTITTEDPEEARRLAKCTDMAIALFDMTQAFNHLHQNVDALNDEGTHILIDHVHAVFSNILNNHGILVDDICR